MIADQTELPNERFAAAWDAIKLDPSVKERLLAQAAFSLTIRTKLPFEIAPLHGLIMLAGSPGTGKTTLARGLANEVAKALKPVRPTFVQIDPHALAGAALGRSQKQVVKLFQQTIPELAAKKPVLVLLDEVETIFADRRRLSLEANPVDVHRAVDAALAGLDLLAQKQRNVIVIATTNFPEALDEALMSRADLVERIPLPDSGAREAIIREVLGQLGAIWPKIKNLAQDVKPFVGASDGLDGRRLRKVLISAAASSIETARDPNKLTAQMIIAALRANRSGLSEVIHESAA